MRRNRWKEVRNEGRVSKEREEEEENIDLQHRSILYLSFKHKELMRKYLQHT